MASPAVPGRGGGSIAPAPPMIVDPQAVVAEGWDDVRDARRSIDALPGVRARRVSRVPGSGDRSRSLRRRFRRQRFELRWRSTSGCSTPVGWHRIERRLVGVFDRRTSIAFRCHDERRSTARRPSSAVAGLPGRASVPSPARIAEAIGRSVRAGPRRNVEPGFIDDQQDVATLTHPGRSLSEGPLTVRPRCRLAACRRGSRGGSPILHRS